MLFKNFNKNWKVCTGFNDSLSTAMFGTKSEYKTINLPHDFLIESERAPSSIGGAAIGFFSPRDCQYKKKFFVSEEDRGKVIYLEFEGVYMNAVVEVNGEVAGKWVYGYGNFYVKISDYLNYGCDNTITVAVYNSAQPNARWYSGNGIYRDVKLIMGEPLHIKLDGVRITTVDVEQKLAILAIETDIEYESIGHQSARLVTVICDTEGNIVSETSMKFNLLSGEDCRLRQRIYIKRPRLWNIDSPNLYTCESRLEVEEKVLDISKNTFGIRKLTLDNLYGLRINGVSVKLKGGCIHHDNGFLGAATYANAEERRIRKLKEAGYNAVRMAHHPMGKRLLEACDKYGMLVMDEFTDTWGNKGNSYDYGYYFSEWWRKDLINMVRKDYNHPCVILYSIGNEIPQTGSNLSAGIGRKLVETIRTIDNTRYITNSINALLSVLKQIGEFSEFEPKDIPEGEINDLMNNWGDTWPIIASHPIASIAIQESCDMLDVVGYNYTAQRYEIDHKDFPNRIFVGSETSPAKLDENWALVEKYPWVIGDFCWTAWDYLGEAGIGRIQYEDSKTGSFMGEWPWIAAFCGDFDLTGYRLPVSYWREIIWGGRNHVPYIAVQRPKRYGQKYYPSNWSMTDAINSWTFPDYLGKRIVVEVYSDAEEIELFINDISKGRKPVGDEKKYYCKWDVTYEDGTVEAVAYMRGKETGRYSIHTALEPTIWLTKESENLHAHTDDLCYVNIELRDKNGILNTATQKTITLSIEGPAILKGSGSANPRMEECYLDNIHQTFLGRMMAILQAGDKKGVAKLTASCEGMDDAIIEIPVL